MACRTSKEEKQKRLAALEQSKKIHPPHGSVTEAARIHGSITPCALSRWLLMQRITVGNKPRFSKEECIAEFRRLVKEMGRIPARDDWNQVSPQKRAWRTFWARYDDFQRDAGVTSEDAKILLLDIETAPNRAFVWGMWKQNINPDWIDADGYVLCWTAKWLGQEESTFKRLKNGNHKALLDPIHRMLSEATAVIHYNGASFDIPTLNKEFITYGFTPPSPYKQIDLLLTMRDKFRFPSNKLDYICKTLSIGEKLRHEGPQLWLNCMNDKPEAWESMERYNRRDVELLEKLYRKLLPWIKNHPNRSAMSGFHMCPSCGSSNFHRDKTHLATLLKYERYQCGDCGTWFRGTKTVTHRLAERFVHAA